MLSFFIRLLIIHTNRRLSQTIFIPCHLHLWIIKALLIQLMAGMMTGMMMKLSAVTMVSRSQRTHCRPYPEETPTLGSADQGLFARAWTGGIWVLNIDDDLTLSLQACKKERVKFHSQSGDFDASFRLRCREWTVPQMLNFWDTLSFVSPPPWKSMTQHPTPPCQ